VPAELLRRKRFFSIWREVFTAVGTFCVAMGLVWEWKSAAVGFLLHVVARLRYVGGAEEEDERRDAFSRARSKLAEAKVRLRHRPAIDSLRKMREALGVELKRHASPRDRRRAAGAIRTGLAQVEVLHRAAKKELELAASQVRLATADLEKAEAELMEIQEVLGR
jgi:type IV secretory pathway TrbD component